VGVKLRLSQREECRLGLYENGRRISGQKGQNVTGWCKKLRNLTFHKFYSSPNIISDQIKKDEMGGTCSTHEMRNAYKVMVGHLEGRTTWET
jgi:hypothetical protein